MRSCLYSLELQGIIWTECVWKRGGGHTSGAKRRKIFVVPLYFLALQVQLVVLVSAFVVVSTVWSVSSLLSFGRSGLVVGNTLACCAWGPRFESRCGQKFVFSRKSLRYAALGTGCTLTAVPRSTQPSTLRGTVNEYQHYGWVIIHGDGRMFGL